MSVHLLSSGEFRVETISRKDTDIGYHRLLNRREIDGKKLHKLLDDMFCLFHALSLPIFLKKQNKFLLIARRWTLDYIIDHKIDPMHIIYFENEDRIPEVLHLDELESQRLPKKPVRGIMRHNTKPLSKYKRTNDRRRAIATGRICPFCEGPLFENKDAGTPFGYHRIACDYESNNYYECTFTALLTDYEFGKFDNFELSTNKWLQHLPEILLRCGQPVYRRITLSGKKSKKHIDLCKNYFLSREGVCDYQPY
jgi:hypothetical protein